MAEEEVEQSDQETGQRQDGAAASAAKAAAARKAKKGLERKGLIRLLWVVAGWLSPVWVFVALLLILVAPAMGAALGGAPAAAPAVEEGIPGLPDISDIPIKKASCGYGNAPGGCYQLPHSFKYWTSYSPASNQTGSKCLVQLVAGTSKAWKLKYPKDTVFIGDLNASGHSSHSAGVDVDLHTSRAANMTLGTYSRPLTVEYGKLWFSTKTIELVFFNDEAVRSQVNSYAQSNKLPGVMQEWEGHEDHFHVRVRVKGNGSCARG